MAIKIALLRNLPNDDYPSMRVVAEGTYAALNAAPNAAPAAGATASYIFPETKKTILGSLVGTCKPNLGGHVNRLLNLFVSYPRQLSRSVLDEFDAFLVCDQCYSNLVHKLPRGRTGVYCHDLYTFYPSLDPNFQPPPGRITRALAKYAADGFKKADIVFYSTESVRAEIMRYGLAPPEKLVKALYGTHPDFHPPEENQPLPAELSGFPYLLHVGSCWQRKRIDVLLDVFANVQRARPEIKLVKVGGTWTDAQQEQINRLGIASGVIHLQKIERPLLASLYGKSSLVLMPSDSEGFGLPIAEALACGAAVLASDMEVFREVGGNAIRYAPIADIPAWTEAALNLLAGSNPAPTFDERMQQASKYSWPALAQTIIGAYQRIL